MSIMLGICVCVLFNEAQSAALAYNAAVFFCTASFPNYHEYCFCMTRGATPRAGLFLDASTLARAGDAYVQDA